MRWVNCRGCSQLVRLDAGEGERARGVAGVEVAVGAALEQRADAHRVLAPDVEVDVVGDLDGVRRPAAVDAGTPLVERIGHVDRRGTRRRRRLVAPAIHLHPDLVQRGLADQPLELDPCLVLVAAPLDGALRVGEIAHALVLGGVLVTAVLEAQGLVAAQRVLDARGEVGGLAGPVHGIAILGPVFVQRVDRRRMVLPVAVDTDPHRRLAGHDRAAEGHVEAAKLLRRLGFGERVAGVQHVAPQAHVGVAAPLPDVGSRDDLDLGAAGVVVVGGERVGAEADLADLVA